MTMSSGTGPVGMSSEINVTPLIDVLLVLLIIFMVIVPVSPKGLSASISQPAKSSVQELSPATIVVSVLHNNGDRASYKINQEEVAQADLLARLTAIYQNRAERVMFVRGDEEVSFSQVARVIDIGHTAGVDHVGLITPKISESF